MSLSRKVMPSCSAGMRRHSTANPAAVPIMSGFVTMPKSIFPMFAFFAYPLPLNTESEITPSMLKSGTTNASITPAATAPASPNSDSASGIPIIA